jgi:predicted GH43/DUF377 family glycosyl hydrolase
MKLTRHPSNPILLPDPTSPWEACNVFNPSVIYHDSHFHMHYRAQGADGISRIGYAISQDGVKWNRMRDPVFQPEGDDESRGVEDPRVTEIEGMFYMAYTAYSDRGPEEYPITPMFAQSRDLLAWDRIGPLVVNENNKDHFLLPLKLRNRFIAFHRRFPDIWYAESEDMVNWLEGGMRLIMSPRPENDWDRVSIGGNGPPIETEFGWLFFYHGYDESLVYRLGVALLDLNDPDSVLNRPREWILEPQETWELQGNVPNVVFSCANLHVGNEVWIYYAGADHVIGLAICDFDEMLDFARFG